MRPPRRIALTCSLVLLAILAALMPGPAAASRSGLGVSPLLVDAAAEVWRLVARPDNAIWPGWNAADTPLLFYLPGEQELLIGHPSPPPGFAPYAGPLTFPGARILVREDSTLITADGQNTSMDVNGVRTLVVADPLSNLRQNVAGLVLDPRPAAEKARSIEFRTLSTDALEQMRLIVHEAFHVHQDRQHPDRGANEGLLVLYPVLAVPNNVGFGLEAGALEGALTSRDAASLRRAAVRWLAIRQHRRAALPARAIEYEDGVEFSEGLAKYTEYRLMQVLEGRTPDPQLARVQGFAGYRDLEPERRALRQQMRAMLRGEVNVNNAPYGTAPLRMRLYYSGMAIAAMLDRLDPEWKPRFWSGKGSLTDAAASALAASPAELEQGWSEAQSDTGRVALEAAKQRLAADGARDAAERLAAFGRGPGTRLIVDYSALAPKRPALGFTPFGITRIDSARVIFDQVPISAGFPDGSELRERFALPLLRDTLHHELHIRLEQPVSREALTKLSGGRAPGTLLTNAKLELPGVDLTLPRATLAWRPGEIRVRLQPDSTATR